MPFTLSHSNIPSVNPYYFEIVAAQQDTIPKVQIRDTTSKQHQGIDPLFLMIERKTQEVEAYKEKVALQRVKSKEQAKPKVDTTCYFCPSAERIPLQNIIISQKSDEALFESPKLYDKDFFYAHYSSNRPVFIETQNTVTSRPAMSFDPNPIPKETFEFDISFYLLFGLVAFSIFIKVFFSIHFKGLIQSNIFFSVANRLPRENSMVWNRLFFLLDLVFFISIPLALYIAIDYLEKVNSTNSDSVILSLIAIGGLLVFRIFRIITTGIIGFLSNQTSTFNLLKYNQFIFPRTLGILIVPLLVLIIYTPKEFGLWAFYFMLVLVGFAILLRLIRTLQVFLYKGFSIFYIILYLCALEIFPILLVYKLVVSE